MRAPEPADAAHYPWPGDDPVLLRRLVAELESVAGAVRALAGDVLAVLLALRVAWPLGAAADAAVTDVRRTRAWVVTVAPRLLRAADVVGVYAAELDRERRRLEELDRAHAVLAPAESALAALPLPPPPADLARWERADADLAVARSVSGVRTTTELDEAYAALVRRLRLLRDAAAAGLAEAGALEAQPGGVAGASSYAAGLLLVAQVADPLAAALARAGLTSVPSTPEGVRAFWSGLTSVERSRLLAADPLRWGDTDGVPARDRDAANRRLLAADLAAGAALLARAGVRPATSPADLEQLLAGLTAAARRRLAGPSWPGLPWAPVGPGSVGLPTEVLRALSVYAGALGTQVALGLAAGVPTLLMVYRPRAHPHGAQVDGRVAVAYGDPDTADDVAVCVPGLQSQVAKLDQVGGDAVRLQREAQAADPTRSTAVVAWQGYDAPEWLTVASQDRARAGGAVLASDVHALVAAHGGGHAPTDPHLTVVGHSYGSTTTGLALQQDGLGADVDDVVLIGSPGVGGAATSVAGLGLAPGRLHVGAASRDVIHVTAGTLLGTDPLDPRMGAVRFEAESVHRDDAGLLDGLGVADHSRYYDPGSESLWSLGEIVSGHGDELGAQGMLAPLPSRARSWTDPPPFAPGLPPPPHLPGVPRTTPYVDPEATRAPTDGHVHRTPS